jgi:HD-GYP domain-containing protein (c-di-GMP phosphodiesterase class II)
MLKKIPVADLRLGMHLHRIEAPWIDHPFWRSRFVLSDPADIAAIVGSRVRECWIETELGVDVPPRPPAAPAAVEAAVSEAAAYSPIGVEPAPAATTAPPLRADLQDAAALCRRSAAAVASMLAEVRLGNAIDAEHCRPLVAEISESVYRDPGALVSLARLKTTDEYSYMHSVAVCALMVSLGRTLGLNEAQCREAGLGGLLHDMGKALMPVEVLNKPGKLTDEEFAVMRTHPERGHAMLVEGRGATAAVLDVCLHHHEKMDGTGYPHRLRGESIALVTRMAAVCDVYDAVTSNRPYKAGWDPAESLSRMGSWAGHFDTAVYSAFVRSLGIYPTGSLVRLASGKLAVVVEQNAQAITSPVVNCFHSAETGRDISPHRLDLARSTDRIVSRESREGWDAARLEGLWKDDPAA